jgi:hypothetical protein
MIQSGPEMELCRRQGTIACSYSVNNVEMLTTRTNKRRLDMTTNPVIHISMTGTTPVVRSENHVCPQRKEA